MNSLNNANELIKGISSNFERADNWLGTQLQNGQFIGDVPAPSVPVNYTAYLEEDGIFDDVKDVLQAFDRQVEQKSREYSRYVATIYDESLNQFEKGLERWHSLASDLKTVIAQITENYNQSIYVKEETITYKKDGDKLIKELAYPQRYWGQLEQLYPSDTLDVISQLENKIISKIDVIQQAILRSERVKGQLQHLEPLLKPIIEEGVYTAFDLDEIVQGQKTVLQIARRLSQEIGHVAQVITGEGMASQSIETLQRKLQDTQRLINYYAQFVSDCFGDNEYSTVSEVPSTGSRFSLNTPLPY